MLQSKFETQRIKGVIRGYEAMWCYVFEKTDFDEWASCLETVTRDFLYVFWISRPQCRTSCFHYANIILAWHSGFATEGNWLRTVYIGPKQQWAKF